MSFRQFPAVAPDGETYVIIEFRDESNNAGEQPSPRYELADGRHLVRQGQQYTTTGGELRLSAA
ncbi:MULTISPECIES: hypothetical protein [Gammaproteobacteria]|jgi:hypothetical protein|uniref:Uncharacterized protein n=1 Tax=Xanthomonas boreopolis TaxID=86183 RepID=A0A919F9A6_9XANT|nr:hypothetical protein [Pseudomonas sp. Hp2]GHH56683.1 hypothetical protein GCM10009090_26870 [[Pseudomonas] boreopolis]